MDQQAVQQAAQLINQAHHVVALTGAGHSTPSGVPDFRSTGSGLWSRVDPMVVASIEVFQQYPRAFFDWSRPLTRLIMDAQPNAAHVALARLEHMGKLKAVITQNIDELHQRAGSRRVLELHGHMRESTCRQCGQVVATETFLDEWLATGNVPYCECGGILKPNVILFGEMLPRDVLAAAQVEAMACDLMLVIGSSLTVMPAATFPEIALERNVPVIILNRDPTHYDQRATVVMHDDLEITLPAIVAAFEELGNKER
ncbi:MAG: NAD-dependent deacylase [Chloroflexi bacterium]|nr:NAD-dependent deacylase [Chloroflexota bacterium]MBU1749407.1 NAD-dependent deacylase [Chloroflexota bacterium]